MPTNETIQPIIEVKELKKYFNSLLVLDKVNFKVNKCETLSIIGPSGSGKTTLLKCVIGLENLNSPMGVVFINGMDRNEYLKKQRVAFVPQRYSNYPWLNVFENIKLGMINHKKLNSDGTKASFQPHASLMPNPFARQTENDLNYRLLNEEKRHRVMEIIESVGLMGFEKYSIEKLSGGMQQRVAIGRALAQDTDIIAFDEPFGALDFKIREKLQLLIKKINKTILFVTHDIEEAIFIADKVVVLSKIPATINTDYRLPFKQMMDPEIKFNKEFVEYKRQIQHKLTQGEPSQNQTNFS